jgi:flagellar hook-length control protein FliK
MPAQGLKTAGKTVSGVVSEIPVESGGKMASQSGSSQAVPGSNLSIEDLLSKADLASSEEEQDPTPALQESASTKTETDPFKIVESLTTFGGQETAILAKQLDKKAGSGDSAAAGGLFQNLGSSLQASEINLPTTDNSAQNGFASYDPYRSAELVQDMRERLGSVARNGLVLEMEPDGLGKVNVKVEARKDEISVVAMTQSEPAKQALMRHSPELRQDLQDQGLVLEKFMVDVNGQKSGGGNYPEANKTGSKITPPPKTAKVSNIQTADNPVYIIKTADRPQISIFA